MEPAGSSFVRESIAVAQALVLMSLSGKEAREKKSGAKKPYHTRPIKVLESSVQSAGKRKNLSSLNSTSKKNHLSKRYRK